MAFPESPTLSVVHSFRRSALVTTQPPSANKRQSTAMQTPSSLNQLSHAEKDTLILVLQKQNTELKEAVKELQGRLNMSSRNSSTLTSAEILQSTVQNIGQAAISSAVLHADETGVRVAKKPHWLHVLATDTLTWMGSHPKRGREAFEFFALLQHFQGVLVHDGWLPYKILECLHALCNQHHLRELTYLLEEQNQDWAGDMIALLTHANHQDNLNCADGKTPDYGSENYQNEVRDLRDLYEAILEGALADHPVVPPTGKRGRTKQSKATNLIVRLRDYSDDVWRFMTQAGVPFTNNLAEQAVRMPKVKQKVSGCFRTPEGAKTYSTIRSYCATMHKQGANIFESLVATFRGSPPQPRFG
jgi:transposase